MDTYNESVCEKYQLFWQLQKSRNRLNTYLSVIGICSSIADPTLAFQFPDIAFRLSHTSKFVLHRPRPHNCYMCDSSLTLTFTRPSSESHFVGYKTQPDSPGIEIACS